MRTVTVELKVKLLIKADEGIEISDVVNELDYNFSDMTGRADIEDMEILDHEVIDSK